MGKLTCTMCGHPIHDEADGVTEMPAKGGKLGEVTVVHLCNECHEIVVKQLDRLGLLPKAIHHDLRRPRRDR